MTIKAFLFSDDEFFNSIIEEQFSSLQGYDLTVFEKITNITKAQKFEKDDIVLSYSKEQNEILKIKKFLSERSYSFPAIIFGSFEEVSTLEKNSFIFLDTPFNFIELLKTIENIVLQRDIIEYSNLDSTGYDHSTNIHKYWTAMLSTTHLPKEERGRGKESR